MTGRPTGSVRVGPTAIDYRVDRPGRDDAPARPPVLLLHPWFGCWRFWLPVTELLPDRTCISVDWYSLSRGDWSAAATPEGLAGAALAVLDELAIEPADVIGNSVGGIVAQLLAADHPDRVRRLVLVGTGATTGCVSTQFAAEVQSWIDDPQVARADGVARAVAVLTHLHLDRDEFDRCVAEVAAADPKFVAAVLRTCRTLDLRPRLAAITAATLVIRGVHDPIRGVVHSEQLLAGITGSRGLELDGCGHAPMLDDPAAFTDAVRGFLDGPAGPAAGTPR